MKDLAQLNQVSLVLMLVTVKQPCKAETTLHLKPKKQCRGVFQCCFGSQTRGLAGPQGSPRKNSKLSPSLELSKVSKNREFPNLVALQFLLFLRSFADLRLHSFAIFCVHLRVSARPRLKDRVWELQKKSHRVYLRTEIWLEMI